MDFTKVQHGLLPLGTETDYGVITERSDTAYKMDDETWVSWVKIHGPYGWTEPLVTFQW